MTTAHATRGVVPDVSIVLPCFRAAEIARESVGALRAYLDQTRLTWEIVVVDDGGGDFSPDDWASDDQVCLVRLPTNRGKGAAVAAGMLTARARVRIFTDVDLPYALDLIPVMNAYIRDSGFHVVIGDRTLPTSSYQEQVGWGRRLLSDAASSFIGSLVTGGFFDTQCGLKAVRGDVADIVFRLLRVERFAFDVELVYIALKYRADVKRIPVQLRRNGTSSVRLVRDSVRALVDILMIKWRQLRRRYASDELTALILADFVATRAAVAAGAPREARRPSTYVSYR